jgi:hypothetical protein
MQSNAKWRCNAGNKLENCRMQLTGGYCNKRIEQNHSRGGPHGMKVLYSIKLSLGVQNKLLQTPRQPVCGSGDAGMACRCVRSLGARWSSSHHT